MSNERLRRFCIMWLSDHPREWLTVKERRGRAAVKVAGALVLATAIFALESTPRAQSLINPPTPPPLKQVHDTGERKSSKLPIAYADDVVTISFHNCRENAKHHWSCQRVNGSDTEHYVYIPGYQPTLTRTSSFAGDADPEDTK